jgi:hypothetical protein
MSKSQEKSLSLLQHLEFEIKEKAPAAEFVFLNVIVLHHSQCFAQF